jgi:hypothetical protein
MVCWPAALHRCAVLLLFCNWYMGCFHTFETMMHRSAWMLLSATVLLHGAAACVGGPDASQLNPQPLPPRVGDEGESKEATGADRGSSSGGGSTESPSAAPSYNTDAGTSPADGGDAGDD